MGRRHPLDPPRYPPVVPPAPPGRLDDSDELVVVSSDECDASFTSHHYHSPSASPRRSPHFKSNPFPRGRPLTASLPLPPAPPRPQGREDPHTSPSGISGSEKLPGAQADTQSPPGANTKREDPRNSLTRPPEHKTSPSFITPGESKPHYEQKAKIYPSRISPGSRKDWTQNPSKSPAETPGHSPPAPQEDPWSHYVTWGHETRGNQPSQPPSEKPKDSSSKGKAGEVKGAGERKGRTSRRSAAPRRSYSDPLYEYLKEDPRLAPLRRPPRRRRHSVISMLQK
ncbi:uncharacterized protein LOC135094890 [Scylla paramamosain]|uniref:uncharacterized protein LOC135094890 n=1 Tax=Scylla paramamosain TaxID=85552 RepID=UPI003082AF84